MSTLNVNTGKNGETGLTEGHIDWVKVPDEVVPTADAQHGIQKIEAVTLTWSKKSLAALLIKYVFDHPTAILHIADLVVPSQ